MTFESQFVGEAQIVEYNARKTPDISELSDWSIRTAIQDALAATNWNITVLPADEGWPVYDAVERPAVYVWMGEAQDRGVELGSDGIGYIVAVQIFGKNDAQRTRLADQIMRLFKRTIPIYNYVTGTESNPEPTGEYFITDDVGWRKIPHVYNAPDSERWRAIVTAVVRRVE